MNIGNCHQCCRKTVDNCLLLVMHIRLCLQEKKQTLPSICLAMSKNNGRFEFSSVDPTLVFSEISKMDSSKKKSGSIPTDKLKRASSACYKEITYHINNAISAKMFPDILKLADVSPIFKMGETFIRGNFRSISVLSSLSKLYETVSSQQIVPFMIPTYFVHFERITAHNTHF